MLCRTQKYQHFCSKCPKSVKNYPILKKKNAKEHPKLKKVIENIFPAGVDPFGILIINKLMHKSLRSESRSLKVMTAALPDIKQKMIKGKESDDEGMFRTIFQFVQF